MSRPGTNYFERNCHSGGPPGLPGPGPGPTDPQGTLFSRTDTMPSNRCGVGRPEFERTVGYELQGQRGYPLLREHVPGITVVCAQRCRADPRCHGFNLDYNRNECTAIENFSDATRIDMRPVPGIAFFEGVCLRGATCGYAWTFERHVNRELRGFTEVAFPAASKAECQDRCLEERNFPCRSATFNNRLKECRLSTENRYTQPHAFQPSPDSDYLENMCAPSVSRCTYRYRQDNRQLIYTDKSLSSFSDFSCQQACDVEVDFKCLSYTFLSQTRVSTNQCLLSGSMGTTLEINGFQNTSGAMYAEKDCTGAVGPFPPPHPGPYPPGPYPPGTHPGTHPGTPGRYPLPSDLDPSLVPYPCRYSLTYEKIAGATFPSGLREPIRTRDDIGISGECLIKCAQLRSHCLAVSLENVRGGRQRCFALDRSADAEGLPLQSAPDLAYFQKICLQETPCTKAWAFTRVPSYELLTPNPIEIRNMFSRRQCQDACLAETRIICRSATYYGRERLCRLSTETRRTQPQHFRRATSDVDYIENECAAQPPSCEYTDYPGRFLPYTDRYVPQIYDVAECKRLCDQEREFPCRSFNYHMVRRDCFLSSDDTFAADRTALLIDRDFFYSERGTCSNVRVDCTQSDMLITFIFGAPFEGRVYATGNPQACFEMGSGQNQLVLRIPMGTQCGTVQQGRGRYVNHVVIQQNPVIMQETDKTVRVECSFDASDQTVSYAPSGTRNQDGGGISVTVPFRPSGTNIVTNTAPTPNVRMRIVTRKGQEAAVVGLGEELLLKIEIDSTSAFGIFVRNLEARTDNGELLTLIDNVGCPRDPNIFPALQVEGGTRNLLGPFKAFRFPSTPTVNFVATVQFCQDICEPIRCSTGVHSFGRKRRQVSSIIEDAENLKLNGNRTASIVDVQSSEDIGLSRLQTTNNTSSTTIDNTETTTVAESSSSRGSELLTNGPESSAQSSDPPLRNPELPLRSSEPPLRIPEPPSRNTESPLRNPEPPLRNPEPPLRKPETTTKNLESSLSENSNETNSSLKQQDPELPNELPLQLRLVVGEDSIPKPSPENKKRNDRKYGPITLDNVGSDSGDLHSNDKTVFYAKSDYVCTPTSTVIASVLTLLLFNIGFIIIFALFYRVRKKQWEKLASVETNFNQVPVPEVLFRSVYGRLPPNPTLTTLSHQLST